MNGIDRRSGHRCVGLAALAYVACVAGTARAHIDLTTPIPREQGLSREPNANLKEGPCGQEENGRTSKVNVFAPGETIEVTWSETTNHRSYYRVAFDRNGDDAFPAFEGPGTGTEGIDPRGPCPVDGEVILAYDMDDRTRGSHTLWVRLPDIECESCTLQVVQFMFDTQRPYYFQCADLALRRAGDAGASAGTASDAGLDASASDAAVEPEPSAAAGCSSRIAPPSPPDDADDETDRVPSDTNEPPPAAADPMTPAAMAPSAARRSDDGGCSLGTPASSPASPVRILFLATCVVLGQIRRRMRPP